MACSVRGVWARGGRADGSYCYLFLTCMRHVFVSVLTNIRLYFFRLLRSVCIGSHRCILLPFTSTTVASTAISTCSPVASTPLHLPHSRLLPSLPPFFHHHHTDPIKGSSTSPHITSISSTPTIFPPPLRILNMAPNFLQ